MSKCCHFYDAMRCFKNNFKTHSWLILKRSCFKPSSGNTFSIKGVIILTFQCSIIFPFALSLNVTLSLFFFVRNENLDSSPIMCLQHPLSKNHLSLFKPYKHNSSNFRYSYLFKSLGVSDFWLFNPNLLYFWNSSLLRTNSKWTSAINVFSSSTKIVSDQRT